MEDTFINQKVITNQLKNLQQHPLIHVCTWNISCKNAKLTHLFDTINSNPFPYLPEVTLALVFKKLMKNTTKMLFSETALFFC